MGRAPINLNNDLWRLVSASEGGEESEDVLMRYLCREGKVPDAAVPRFERLIYLLARCVYLNFGIFTRVFSLPPRRALLPSTSCPSEAPESMLQTQDYIINRVTLVEIQMFIQFS